MKKRSIKKEKLKEEEEKTEIILEKKLNADFSMVV